MGGCCSVSGGSVIGDLGGGGEEWAQWDNHPARKVYEVLEDIGEGAFSKVVRARHMQTKEEVALKVVHRLRPGVKPHHWEILHGEKETLQSLRHQNIIHLKESFEDNNQLVMVLEMLKGGELLEHLKSIKFYNEQKGAQLFRQIADAVHFMHENGYLHRDLKPENVLFVEKATESPKDTLTVKLIDMGMATRFSPSNPVRGAMGTAGFLAPECCHRVPHSPAMDIWSLGMLLFTMLTGRMPYSHSQIERLHYPEIPITKSPGVQSHRFLGLSKDAQELLLGMLQHDPILRMTAWEVLTHRWVVTEGSAKPMPTEATSARPRSDSPKGSVNFSNEDNSTELKAERSRKNLREIKQQSSRRSSLKNLLGKKEAGGAEATRSRSRFDLIDDSKQKGPAVGKGLFDMDAGLDDDDDDEEIVGLPSSKSTFGVTSRRMRGKSNKIAAAS